jgi:hypothetical protein
MSNQRALTLLVAAGLALGACSSDPNAPGAVQSRMQLRAASRSTTTPTSRTAAFDITSSTPGTFTDGTNTLVLTKAQLVLRKIEMKRADATVTACADVQMSADMSGPGSGESEPGDDHGDDGVADDCEEVELGPVLFDVPVASAGAQQSVSVNLDAGTYDAVEFKIRPPDASADQAFLQANPTFAGKSIHLEGTWNGAPFSFDSDLSAEEELKLDPPVTLAASGTADVTIFVDVSAWFANQSGQLVDPSTAGKGQPNESLVAANIERSFHAFEDENGDGEDDHGTD